MLSGQKVDVVLVEPQDQFVSCPLSNLVLGGSKSIGDLTTSYSALESRHGVRRVKDWVKSIDDIPSDVIAKLKDAFMTQVALSSGELKNTKEDWERFALGHYLGQGIDQLAMVMKQIKEQHGAQSIGALVSPHSTLEELFLTGLHIEQYRHATYRPDPYYLEGLKRDPGDIRINNAYGSLLKIGRAHV